jgi:hypothetical protein
MFRRAVSPGDEQLQSTARDIASARCRALISTKDAMKQAARHNQQGPHGKQGEQDEPGEQGPRRLAASLRRACSVLTARSSTPHELEVPHWTATLFRWSLGLALVSWRYLWQTTPLHRREEVGDVRDLPRHCASIGSTSVTSPWHTALARCFTVCSRYASTSPP